MFLFFRAIPAPTVKWAQRANLLLLTICLEDVKEPTIQIEPTKLYFKGVGGTEKKLHEVTINFFKEIDPDVSVGSGLDDINIFTSVIYENS